MAGPATPEEKTLHSLSSRAALPLGGVAIPTRSEEIASLMLAADNSPPQWWTR